ncbi:MAG: ABC transporter ATP-binding protein [Acidimicrobiia bacterium]
MLLSASNIAVKYRNGAFGVVDVSLNVAAGGVVSLLGANGAGKTTTVRALSGFLRTEGAKVVKGSIVLDGTDVTGWEPHRLSRLGVAALPERNKVFRNLSVREHLTSAGLHCGRTERDAAVEFGMNLFPILRERYKQSAGRLSGGQQQMLAMARALASCPKLLIVDEMTLGLHPSLQPVLFDALRTIAGTGTAVLVVDESTSHALDTADYCYLIQGGYIVLEGQPETFKGSELIAAGYLGDEGPE